MQENLENESIFRLGLTETRLVYSFFLETKFEDSLLPVEKESIISEKKKFLNWLFTTSGFYDKTIRYDSSKNKLIDANELDQSSTYKTYMQITLKILLKTTKYKLIKDSILFKSNYKEKFIDYCKENAQFYKDTVPDISMTKLYQQIMKNKDILIISSFCELIQQQIENGNFYRLVNEDGYEINSVKYYTTQYTFFNNGPHSNIFETFNYYIQDITKKCGNNYSVVFISCGAYSTLFFDHFYNQGKMCINLGGQIQEFFGILNQRYKEKSQNGINNILEQHFGYNYENPNLIREIDDKYKPPNHKGIEGGCYW